MSDVIDQHGYRANVGIILTDGKGHVFWARRVGQESWQFPQGGVDFGESPLDAMYRELGEEVGLTADNVEIVGATKNWIRYKLPKHLIRWKQQPLCVGQKQIWFLLKLDKAGEQKVRFDTTNTPEFDGWKWVDPWEPIRDVVFFKQDVYRRAMRELAPFMFSGGLPNNLQPYLRPKGSRHAFRQ